MKTRFVTVKTVSRIVIACTLCVVAASCASSIRSSRDILEDPSQYEELEALSLDLGHDIFMFRVDLKRATRTVSEMGLDMKEHEVEKELPYSPILLDLGEGLILDLNGNLCIDLLRLYGLNRLEQFTIESKGVRAGNTQVLAEKKDGAYTISRKWGSPGSEAGKISEFESESEDENQSVLVSEFTAVYKMKDSLGFRFLHTLKKTSPTEAELDSRYGVFNARIKDNELQLDKETILTHKGNSMETAGYTLIKSGNSVFIFDKLYSGIELRLEGTQVLQLINDKVVRRYNLLSAE